jgi:hypothetical protein
VSKKQLGQDHAVEFSTVCTEETALMDQVESVTALNNSLFYMPQHLLPLSFCLFRFVSVFCTALSSVQIFSGTPLLLWFVSCWDEAMSAAAVLGVVKGLSFM